MKQINLTKGYITIVDDIDYDFAMSGNAWHINRNGHFVYAVREIRRESELVLVQRLHRAILERKLVTSLHGLMVDHINHNTLDNTRDNLRPATPQQNSANARKRAGCSSIYKGVTWEKALGKWRAMIRVNGKLIHLGSFSVEEEAAEVYNAASKKHFGEFACTESLVNG